MKAAASFEQGDHGSFGGYVGGFCGGLFSRSQALLAMSCLSIAALVGCGSSSSNTDTTAIPQTFTGVYTNVFSTACVQCHTGASGSADTSPYSSTLDFTNATNAYNTLVGTGVPVQVMGTASSGCHASDIVAPGNPSASYLAAVLFADYKASWTACSPYAAHLQDQNLSAAEETAIIGWIQAGAQNN